MPSQQMKPAGWGIACRRGIWAGLLLCVMLYYVMSPLNPFGIGPSGHEIAEGYFVNTSGCRVMALSPWFPHFSAYFLRVEPKKCFGLQLFEGQSTMGKNYLVRNLSVQQVLSACKVQRMSDIECTYITIYRGDDWTNVYHEQRSFRLDEQETHIQVEDGDTFLRIWCLAGNRTVYHDVHFFYGAETLPRTVSSSPDDSLSVMIVGIDSVSHMHYLRSMPSLGAYIGRLPHVEFWGYNRVGANSYPNLVPMFSGLAADELEASCYNDRPSYDDCDLIWKHFKAAGYNTSFAEDSSIGGTFNYGKRGFRRQPTDFYLRPVMLEVDLHTRYSIDQRDEIHCSAGRTYADILHEFIYKRVPLMRLAPSFSFFWQSQGVHDYFNYAQLMDAKYLQLLRLLNASGVLNRTLVLLMSDHGMRFGAFRSTYQGMLEESQPLLVAIYPKWFQLSYPLAIKNLQRNAHSLVTTFDLHATLKDLTNLTLLRNSHIKRRATKLQSLGRDIPRGISLFLPIPEIRDCEMAGIPASYCLCHSLSSLDTGDHRAQLGAKLVVESINRILSPEPRCQRLTLKQVKAAYLLNRSDDVYQFEVKVQVQTSPGDGLFEGTARFSGGSLALNGVVIRANKYGNQSHCIRNYRIEMYCYCF